MQLSPKPISKRHLTKRDVIYMLIVVSGAFSRFFFYVAVVYTRLKLVMGLIWHTPTNPAPLRNQFV